MKNIEEMVYGKLFYDKSFWKFGGDSHDESLFRDKHYILVERYNKILKIIYANIAVKGKNLNFDKFSKFDKIMSLGIKSI